MNFKQKFLSKIRSILYVSTGGFGFFAGYSYYRGDENFYTRYLMPCVHRLDAESAHRLAVLTAKYGFTPKSQYSDPVNLKTIVLGLDVENPIGLAAGFDKDAEAVEGLLALGFGFVEVGSVTPLPQPGNTRPRVFRLPEQLAVINRYGFNSLGHEAVSESLGKLRSDSAFHGVVGVNLGKNKTSPEPIHDYVLGIRRFSPLADYLVINISSPNTPGLREWQKPEQLEALLSAVLVARDQQPIRRPLLLKLSPDLTQQERKDVARVISKPQCKVDGLIISNTTIERFGGDAGEQGGLSGAPLKPLSNALIADMYALTQGLVPIIGVGGVFSGQDAFDKIAAGASLLQLYTCLVYYGPPRLTKIKQELHQCLTANGFSSVSEAVGSHHRKKPS